MSPLPQVFRASGSSAKTNPPSRRSRCRKRRCRPPWRCSMRAWQGGMPPLQPSRGKICEKMGKQRCACVEMPPRGRCVGANMPGGGGPRTMEKGAGGRFWTRASGGAKIRHCHFTSASQSYAFAPDQKSGRLQNNQPQEFATANARTAKFHGKKTKQTIRGGPQGG